MGLKKILNVLNSASWPVFKAGCGSLAPARAFGRFARMAAFLCFALCSLCLLGQAACRADSMGSGTAGGITLTRTVINAVGIPLEGEVTIPETVSYEGRTWTVTAIGENAFDSTAITGVTIPDTVTVIEVLAFNKCSKLEYVNFPSNLKTVGRGAFQLCSSLKEVNLPDSLTELGNFAFNHCSGYQGSTFTLPASLKTVGASNRYLTHMFYNMGTSSFKEFVMEGGGNDSLWVEDGILYTSDGCLVSIPRGKDISVYEMPNWVTDLGELSFSRNMNIHKVVISDLLEIEPTQQDKMRHYNCRGNTLSIAEYGYTDVNEYGTRDTNKKYASKDGIIYTKDMTTIVAVPNHYKGVIDIPEGVTSWQKDALWGYNFEYGYPTEILSQVTEVSIPATMSDIPTQQVETVNKMKELYGTKITVSPGNKDYYVDSDGLLATYYIDPCENGHDMGVAVVTKKATAFHTGLKVATCSRCGYQVKTTIKKKKMTTEQKQLKKMAGKFFTAVKNYRKKDILYFFKDQSKIRFYSGKEYTAKQIRARNRNLSYTVTSITVKNSRAYVRVRCIYQDIGSGKYHTAPLTIKYRKVSGKWKIVSYSEKLEDIIDP